MPVVIPEPVVINVTRPTTSSAVSPPPPQVLAHLTKRVLYVNVAVTMIHRLPTVVPEMCANVLLVTLAMPVKIAMPAFTELCLTPPVVDLRVVAVQTNVSDVLLRVLLHNARVPEILILHLTVSSVRLATF